MSLNDHSQNVTELIAELRQKAEYPTVGSQHTRIIPVRLLLAAANALEQPSGPEDEYICKCGIRVTPHRCSTGTDF